MTIKKIWPTFFRLRNLLVGHALANRVFDLFVCRLPQHFGDSDVFPLEPARLSWLCSGFGPLLTVGGIPAG
ncbi:hypothetical protein [Tateyamaria omphalii]|uniref:hypothetical protein n=1 Tax=Tateyamaria omphalii TaxID=299262 RepID=UPI00155FD822|nr:hypothetical protein [Tateyamaria omphalii]